MQPKDKFELCDDYDEIFAMVFNDREVGEAGLKALLKKLDLAREDAEDAALGLADAGMHKAAKIVTDFAQGQPSECDRDVYPWPPNTTNAKHWHASQPKRQQSREWSRAERRRRKREGTW
jgi:hypothetical protein